MEQGTRVRDGQQLSREGLPALVAATLATGLVICGIIVVMAYLVEGAGRSVNWSSVLIAAPLIGFVSMVGLFVSTVRRSPDGSFVAVSRRRRGQADSA
jgi:uncharacterized membrane protein YfcA